MVLGAVLVLIGLPVVLALVEAVSFHVQNRNNGSIVSSGQKREYLLYVPKSYDRAKPTPLVISMHGGALWGAAQREISQWNEVAEREGVIVVYPSGIEGPGTQALGSEPRIRTHAGCPIHLGADRHAEGGLQHRRDDASTQTGFPMAAAWRSSCPARCPIGSRRSGWWRLLNYCRGTGVRTDEPVPMIAFHGTADRQVPYNGGRTWVAPVRFPSIPDLDGELGSKEPVRNEPGRFCGGRGRHPPRIHELC